MSGKGGESALSVLRLRFGYMFRFFGRVMHYGFVPFIIYLGLSLGQTDPNSPELNLRSLMY